MTVPTSTRGAWRAVLFRLGCLALNLLAGGTPARELPTDAEIRTILQNFIERDHWGVGMVVGIVDEHGTRIISYGKLDNGESPEVNGDTLFEIGSITKTFTTLLLEDMVQRGEMRLEDPIEKFLPASVKVPGWDGRKITLLDLATHTSALPRDLNGDWTIARMYEFLSHYRLRRRPGRKVEYSNLGVALLAHALELKAGTNFEALAQERICRPLNMESTCVNPTASLRPRWAKSHGQENRVVGDIVDVDKELPGAGAIRSTANDMLKYLAANLGLNDCALTGLMEKTHSVQRRHAFGEADLALPWFIYRRHEAELITHGGSTSGHRAFIGFDKKLKRGVVVLANRNDAFDQAAQPLGIFLLHPPAASPTAVKLPHEILDSYVGLYEFPNVPQAILTIRSDGQGLIPQLLNSPGGSEWVALSSTEFADSWASEARLKLKRSASGRTVAVFTSPSGGTQRARKVSDWVPESLFQPMLEPLRAGEWGQRKDSDLQGTWEGTLRPWFWPFWSLYVKLTIAEPSPGVFRAELDVPSQNANNQPLSVIYHPPGVELVVRSGAGMFTGKIDTDHTRMTGRWVQGHYSLALTLRRAGP